MKPLDYAWMLCIALFAIAAIGKLFLAASIAIQTDHGPLFCLVLLCTVLALIALLNFNRGRRSHSGSRYRGGTKPKI